ncbi:MAG: hypothetical protein ACI8ZM_000683 [Crocinitomix sp.]|jgi:hypothetical protein
MKKVALGIIGISLLLGSCRMADLRTDQLKENQVTVEQTEKGNKIFASWGTERTKDYDQNVLFIGDKSGLVEGHRNRILEKTGFKNVAGLVVYAFKNNLVEPSP